MIPAGIFICLALLWRTGLGFSLACIFFSFHLLLPEASLPARVVFLALLLSVPAAAILTSVFLQKLYQERSGTGIVPVASIVLLMALFLSRGMFERYLSAARHISGDSLVSLGAILVSVFGSALFAASAVALALGVLLISFELPVRWFLSAQRVYAPHALGAARVLLIVCLLSAGVDIVADHYIASLDARPW